MHIKKNCIFYTTDGKKESVYPKSIIYIVRTCKTTCLKIAKNLNSNCFSKKKKKQSGRAHVTAIFYK